MLRLGSDRSFTAETLRRRKTLSGSNSRHSPCNLFLLYAHESPYHLLRAVSLDDLPSPPRAAPFPSRRTGRQAFLLRNYTELFGSCNVPGNVFIAGCAVSPFTVRYSQDLHPSRRLPFRNQTLSLTYRILSLWNEPLRPSEELNYILTQTQTYTAINIVWGYQMRVCDNNTLRWK